MMIKDFHISIIVINKIRFIIFTYFFLTITIEYIDLLINRDLIFQLK